MASNPHQRPLFSLRFHSRRATQRRPMGVTRNLAPNSLTPSWHVSCSVTRCTPTITIRLVKSLTDIGSNPSSATVLDIEVGSINENSLKKKEVHFPLLKKSRPGLVMMVNSVRDRGSSQSNAPSVGALHHGPRWWHLFSRQQVKEGQRSNSKASTSTSLRENSPVTLTPFSHNSVTCPHLPTKEAVK